MVIFVVRKRICNWNSLGLVQKLVLGMYAWLIVHEYEEWYKGRFLDHRRNQSQHRLSGYSVALGHSGFHRRIHVPASERALPDGKGEPPMIIHTFCETYPALKDKTIIPFGTHGGSGVGSYTTKLKGHFPEAKYLEALGINGASVREEASRDAVNNWLDKLGFKKKETN